MLTYAKYSRTSYCIQSSFAVGFSCPPVPQFQPPLVFLVSMSKVHPSFGSSHFHLSNDYDKNKKRSKVQGIMSRQSSVSQWYAYCMHPYALWKGGCSVRSNRKEIVIWNAGLL